MSDDELRIRARRLLAGNVHLEDLDRLFLDQRERSHGRTHFREIGDFLAHRSTRNKGPVTAAIRDIMTSFRVWSMPMRQEKHTVNDIRAAGDANLRLLTEEQLSKGCGARRQAAASKFRKGMAKLETGQPLSNSEERVVLFLGNHFVWRPAFNDRDLLADFLVVLRNNGLIVEDQLRDTAALQRTLALYALSRMHETIIQDQHMQAQLFAGAANDYGVLEVRLDINTEAWAKPLTAPVCIFMTSLLAADHCAPCLPLAQSALDWKNWSYPIELSQTGKLMRLV